MLLYAPEGTRGDAYGAIVLFWYGFPRYPLGHKGTWKPEGL